MHIFCFSGSPNNSGLNTTLLHKATEFLQKEGATCSKESIDSLTVPLYSPKEEEKGMPKNAQNCIDLIKKCDAVVIACPEYNASMPGHVKNLIDWISRERPSPFAGKPILLLSASPGIYGGNRGLWALRIPLEQLGAHVFPTMYSLSKATDTIHEPKRIESLQKLITTFIQHVK